MHRHTTAMAMPGEQQGWGGTTGSSEEQLLDKIKVSIPYASLTTPERAKPYIVSLTTTTRNNPLHCYLFLFYRGPCSQLFVTKNNKQTRPMGLFMPTPIHFPLSLSLSLVCVCSMCSCSGLTLTLGLGCATLPQSATVSFEPSATMYLILLPIHFIQSNPHTCVCLFHYSPNSLVVLF